MANNMTIQNGTALPRNIVFSSLRQEMIRRMLNCEQSLDWDERLSIIEEYVQVLVNSGHRYKFIKSVILQGLTRYKFMLSRSKLNEGDIKYMPLYRNRSFQQIARKMNKCVAGMTWYKDLNLYDPFRKEWKNMLSSRKQITSGPLGRNRETVAVMFVPPSNGSQLINKVEAVENELRKSLSWNVKVMEQSGTPLALIFIP